MANSYPPKYFRLIFDVCNLRHGSFGNYNHIHVWRDGIQRTYKISVWRRMKLVSILRDLGGKCSLHSGGMSIGFRERSSWKGEK